MSRTVIYSYGDGDRPDLEIDLTGRLSIKIGDLISRRDKTWKVQTIHLERENNSTRVWVILVEPVVN